MNVERKNMGWKPCKVERKKKNEKNEGRKINSLEEKNKKKNLGRNLRKKKDATVNETKLK